MDIVNLLFSLLPRLPRNGAYPAPPAGSVCGVAAYRASVALGRGKEFEPLRLDVSVDADPELFAVHFRIGLLIPVRRGDHEGLTRRGRRRLLKRQRQHQVA